MSVLVYTESDQGNFKKAALEAASYGKAVAEAMCTTLTAVTFKANDASKLKEYGVENILIKRAINDLFGCHLAI